MRDDRSGAGWALLTILVLAGAACGGGETPPARAPAAPAAPGAPDDVAAPADVAEPPPPAPDPEEIARAEQAAQEQARLDALERSALQIEIGRGDLEAVRVYLAAGRPPDVSVPWRPPNRSIDAMTALHFAAEYCQPEIAELLISAGAPLEARTSLGMTPLHQAAEACDDAATVVVLLRAGASVHARDEWRMTPVHRAASKPRRGATIAALLEAGAPPDEQDRQQLTALASAIDIRGVDNVRALLAGGADVNAPYGKYDRSPLHAAAMLGSLELATVLLDAKANVKALDVYGWTPLHEAASKGHLEVVQLLVKRRAPLKAKDTQGKTPRDRAAAKGHAEIAAWLKKKGG